MLYSGKDMSKGAKELKVCGIIEYGLYDLDSRLAYVSLDTGKTIFPEALFTSSLRIRLNDGVKLEKAVNDLEENLPLNTRVRSWEDINYGMLESVKLDKLVITFILSMLIAVAVFNVVATLFLLTREMRPEISMLQVLGLNMFRITRMFFLKRSSLAYQVILWEYCSG